MNQYVIGVIITVIALIALGIATYKGVPILIASPICGAIILVGNGVPLLEGLTGPYIGEAASFFKSWFLFFLLGAILGVIMEQTGAASSMAHAVSKTLGAKFAMPAVTLICGLLMIGGVSGFVVVFAVYPFAVELFREADIPRKYMVATMATSVAGWAMWLPGVPMTQNVIPMQVLGTTATAGLVVGIICFVFQWGLSILYLNWCVKRDHAKGIHFESREKTVIADEADMPAPWTAIVPLLVVFITFAVFNMNILYSLFIGVVLSLIILRKQVGSNLMKILGSGCESATGATMNICMIMAVAGAFKATDTFTWVVDNLLALSFHPLISAALAVNICCGLTASATGGLTVALPIIGPEFVAMGAHPAALHRMSAIACGVLDSMPHSGWFCSTRDLCKTTHAESYGPFAVICIGIAFLTLVLCVALFMLFPFLCNI